MCYVVTTNRLKIENFSIDISSAKRIQFVCFALFILVDSQVHFFSHIHTSRLYQFTSRSPVSVLVFSTSYLLRHIADKVTDEQVNG